MEEEAHRLLAELLAREPDRTAALAALRAIAALSTRPEIAGVIRPEPAPSDRPAEALMQ